MLSLLHSAKQCLSAKNRGIASINRCYSSAETSSRPVRALFCQIERVCLCSNLVCSLTHFFLLKNRVFVSTSEDPFWNLAFENYLLEEKRRENTNSRWLFLWRNQPSVILGRHQNPWTECNMLYMKAQNIPLVRRQSGGGTVYHDLGNTCISIFADKHEPERNLQFACDVLRETYSLNAYISPRKDIFVDEFKVSGSAFRITNKACYHHFTLLLSTDLDVLEKTLTPAGLEMESKATASVRSKVLNLASRVSITHESLSSALATGFAMKYPNGDKTGLAIDVWNHDRIASNPEVQATFHEYTDWSYIYGRTPEFTQQLHHDFGDFAIHMSINVLEGVVQSASVETEPNDFVIDMAVQNALVGCPYNATTLSQTLLGQSASIHSEESERKFLAIRDWFVSSLHV